MANELTAEQFNNLTAGIDGITKKFPTFEQAINRIPTLEQQIKTLQGDLERKQAAIDAVEKAYAKIAADASGLGQGSNQGKDFEAKRLNAFYDWARYNQPIPEEFRKYYAAPVDMGGREQKAAMLVSNNTTGGYLAPVELVKEITKLSVEIDPLWQLCKVRTTTAKAIEVPKRTGGITATWEAEGDDAAESNPTYGMDEIANYGLKATILVTQDNLEDSGFNLEQEIAESCGEQFPAATGKAFLDGAGPKKPEGILTNALVPEYHSGDAALIKPKTLMKMTYELKDDYLRNPAFIMRRATIGLLAEMTDATGKWLFPELQNRTGGRPTLFGYPVYACPSMPAVAGGAFPIAFGDFNRAYTITNRVEMTIFRDPYTLAHKNTVRLIARKRVGGKVMVPEALIKYEIAA